MSVVTVQLGQCGNQVGHQFFHTLTQDLAREDNMVGHKLYQSESLKRFFYNPQDDFCGEKATAGPRKSSVLARAVLIDTEGKVVQNVIAEAKKSAFWKYDEKQSYSRRRGAGNNWADGFHGQGPRFEEEVAERVQREVEKCDAFSGFLTLMSVAGGTGSGVGTRITQTLQDNYPNAFLLNHIIWPHGAGEVILQNYNAILSLAHLYQCADAVLISHNDSMKALCSQYSTNVQQNVTFRDMNKIIAHQMSIAFQPARLAPTSVRQSAGMSSLGFMMEHLVPHPDYKLLTLRSVPQVSEAAMAFSTFNYHSLLTRLKQMLITGSVVEEGINWHLKLPTKPSPLSQHNKSLSCQLTVRGKDASRAPTDEFNNPVLYPDWIPPMSAFAAQSHERPFGGQEKTASLLSNCQTPVRALDAALTKAWGMFAMRAYIHWYTRYGMVEEEFIDCFAGLEQVVQNYKQL